jgi:hypothetical protein
VRADNIRRIRVDMPTATKRIVDNHPLITGQAQWSASLGHEK